MSDGPFVPFLKRARSMLGQAISGAPPQDEERREREQRRAEKAQKRMRAELKETARSDRRARAARLAQELSADGDGVERLKLDYPSADLYLLASSDMERDWRAHSCAKEPWTVAWLEASLANGGVLYDIGANVGAFTLIAARLCAGRGAVVAFEPGYASYARLCDNVVLNRSQETVLAIPLALGRTTGVGMFQYRTLHPGQSRHTFDERGWMPAGQGVPSWGPASAGPKKAGDGPIRQPVLSITLDDAVERFGLPRPNYIKLDVDGAEMQVLQGASVTLASSDLRSVLIEVDETLTGPVIDVMQRHGFALDGKHKRAHDELTQVWYGVFKRA